MSEETEGGQVLLEKLDQHTGKDFPVMFLDFNEHGVSGVMLIELSKGVKSLFGEYSEMTPMLDHVFGAFDRAVLSSASINGKMRNSFLQKMYKITQISGGDMMQKKPGMFSGLEGLVKGQQRNIDASGEMRSMGGM